MVSREVAAGSGPATVYGARAFGAFREFYTERVAQADARQPVS